MFDTATLLAGVLTFLATIISIYFQDIPYKREILKKQLDDVYFPLFTVLESYINQNPSNDEINSVIEKIHEIVTVNLPITDPSIITCVRQIQKRLIASKDCQGKFFDLCF